MNLQKLEALKTKKNLSNKEISELTGISPPTIGRIFNGQGEPSFENVAAIIRVIGGSMDELAGIRPPSSSDAEALRAENEILRREGAAKDRALDAFEGRVQAADRATEYLKRQSGICRWPWPLW